LNPSTDYSIDISKNLLDNDNYPLMGNYYYDFTTNDIINEDKRLNYLDYSNEVLIPENIDPISV
jgi:hypothetical protein